ncbi:unnamed protein product [Penicillium camemberti]|uniref:Str. FM013 n=1 Tax=Penicillium camemberti (strain FM 013) TaxID=1429867 RepID=A0A0G4PUD7_PENC3|nr:unnamed protein product [Penicillium camemberti]
MVTYQQEKALAQVAAAVTKPETTVQKLINKVVDYTVDSNITSRRVIPALSVLYTFSTIASSSTLSVVGQAMSIPHGLDNDHLRKDRGKMEGLPLGTYHVRPSFDDIICDWGMSRSMLSISAIIGGFWLLAKS